MLNARTSTQKHPCKLRKLIWPSSAVSTNNKFPYFVIKVNICLRSPIRKNYANSAASFVASTNVIFWKRNSNKSSSNNKGKMPSIRNNSLRRLNWKCKLRWIDIVIVLVVLDAAVQGICVHVIIINVIRLLICIKWNNRLIKERMRRQKPSFARSHRMTQTCLIRLAWSINS